MSAEDVSLPATLPTCNSPVPVLWGWPGKWAIQLWRHWCSVLVPDRLDGGPMVICDVNRTVNDGPLLTHHHHHLHRCHRWCYRRHHRYHCCLQYWCPAVPMPAHYHRHWVQWRPMGPECFDSVELGMMARKVQLKKQIQNDK